MRADLDNIATMKDFFKDMSSDYEKHMQEFLVSYEDYYKNFIKIIKPTVEPIKILNLGCGSGLEILDIFKILPNANITCVDLSSEMMAELKSNFRYSLDNFIFKESFLQDFDYKENEYDYIITSMVMHHFDEDEKMNLYNKYYKSLKDGGYYIEGDNYVSASLENAYINEYLKLKEIYAESIHNYHIDIPMTIEHQKSILLDSHFKNFKILYQDADESIISVNK